MRLLKENVVIATRKSPLALTQTRMVMHYLSGLLPSHTFTTLELVTSGDRQLDWSLAEKGGKGLFTSELERAVLAGEADLAVHSSKDLPTSFPEGLSFAGFLPRERANDVLVLREGCDQPKKLATGSPRRQAQAGLLFPRATWMQIRGNVATRLNKIAEGQADGTVMAAAGLRRLGIESHPGLVFRELTRREMVPAPGQGAIAVQCCSAMAAELEPLFDIPTKLAVYAERAFLSVLGGGCHSAFAAHFHAGELEVFHEKIGYRTASLPGVTVDNVEEKVRDVAAEWGLLGAQE